MSTLPSPTQSVEVKNAETPLGPPGDSPQAPATQPAAPPKPPEGFAPIAAVSAEQKIAKEAREQLANYKAQMQLYGWQEGQDGTLLPPQQVPQAQAPQAQVPAGGFGPATQSLAERLGVTAQELAGVISEVTGPMAAQYASPLAEGMATIYSQNLSTSDPYYAIYEKDFKAQLRTIPAQVRGHPQALEWARQIAKGMHTEEIATKIAEQRANPGRAVGSFNVEGASPGAGSGSPAQLPPELAGWAEGMPPEAVARAAERIRRNRGG